MSATGRAGKAYLVGVGLLLCLAGVVFFSLMWRSYERSRAMAAWPQTEAVVLVSEVEERQIGPDVPPDFRWKVVFGYQVDGKPLTSERWTLRGSPWSSKREISDALVEKYPAGAQLPCFYDPADPANAVLKLDTKAVGYAIWFPGLFIVGGLGIALRAVLGRRG